MRFVVFGAGALGSLVAARLASSHEVSLVGRSDHVEAIRERGLSVSGHTELRQTALTAVADPEELGKAPDVNPLTALLRKRTGELIGDEALEEALGLVVEESVAIAEACGVSVEAAEILAKIRTVAEATRDNKSSMFQDLERGRRTEIDAINGALVERARAHGIPCPANELLAHIVRDAEIGRGRPQDRVALSARIRKVTL